MSQSNYFEAGNILYVKNYIFEDNPLEYKNKFMLVLGVDDIQNTVLRLLLTSNDRNNINPNAGCNQKGSQTFYFIPSNTPITNLNFSFSKDTYIFYPNNIIETPLTHFLVNNRGDIEPKGKLFNDEYKKIIECILHSNMAPRNLKTKIQNLQLNSSVSFSVK